MARKPRQISKQGKRRLLIMSKHVRQCRRCRPGKPCVVLREMGRLYGLRAARG